jgi:hypothetical protein
MATTVTPISTQTNYSISDEILLNPSVFDNVRITAYSLNKGLIVTKNSLLSYVTEFKQTYSINRFTITNRDYQNRRERKFNYSY